MNKASSRRSTQPAVARLEDEIAVHLGVELEVEVIQALVRVAETCLFLAPLEQPLAAAVDFVRDQRGEHVDGRHVLCLRLKQARFQHGHHTAQPQLMQGTTKFDQVHGWFPRS